MNAKKEAPQEALIRKLGNEMATIEEIEKAKSNLAKLLNNRFKKKRGD